MDLVDKETLSDNEFGEKLLGEEWEKLTAKIVTQDDRIISQMGKPQGLGGSRKRKRFEARRLQATRLKFILSWVAAFNSGSETVMEQFISNWIKPDVIFREQYIHYVPHTLVYREVHSTRLLFQYLMTILRAFPDALYTSPQQTLKTKRDGGAYVIATFRIIGSYTFRLLTTNATCKVSQFLTQANPLHSAINNDHLLNRSQFRSMLRGQQGLAPCYVSSFPAVYHTKPIEYDVFNGVLVPKGESSELQLTLPPPQHSPKPISTAMGTNVDYFDDEAVFQDMVSVLLAPDDADDGVNCTVDVISSAKRCYVERVSSNESTSKEEELDPVVSSETLTGDDNEEESSVSSSHYVSSGTSSQVSQSSPRLSPNVTKYDESKVRHAEQDVLNQRDMGAKALREAFRQLPRQADSCTPVVPSPVFSNIADPTDDATLPGSSSPVMLPSLNSRPNTVSPYDFVKVSTPFTQFFTLDKLPQVYPVDVSQTFVVYFESGSDQVHRIDVYKRDSHIL